MEQHEIEQTLGCPLRLTLEDIANHPRLPEAQKVYFDHFLGVYGDDPFLVRLLIESGRFFVFNLAVLLEAGQDPARRETWLTVGLLKQHLAVLGFASGRHIDHLIGRLCAVGYMQSRPSEHDRRVRILSPTEKMRAHDRDWLAAHYAPLAFLYPHHDYSLVMRRDPAFQAVQRRASMPFRMLGVKLMADMPDMMLFFHRAGGYMVIAALLQTAMTSSDHPYATVPYTDVGDRFGISRTQVRNLLVAAEEAGLVKLHARGGRRVEILPRLWDSHSRSIAGGMYLHDIAHMAAMQAMNAEAERPTAAAE